MLENVVLAHVECNEWMNTLVSSTNLKLHSLFKLIGSSFWYANDANDYLSTILLRYLQIHDEKNMFPWNFQTIIIIILLRWL